MHVIVDVTHTRGQSLDGQVEVVSPATIRGMGVSDVNPIVSLGVQVDEAAGLTTGTSTIYFVARFSKPFTTFGTWTSTTQQPGVTMR